MDFNGGVNPTDQAGTSEPQYSSQPQELQQAPMSGVNPAYQADLNQQAQVNQIQPQFQAIAQPPVQEFVAQPQQQVVGQPIQDVRPSWQQDIEYSTPVDPPWTRQQAGTVAVSGGITSYTGDPLYQNPPATSSVPSDAYDILTEPYSDYPQSGASGGSPKKVILIVLALIVSLSLIGAAVYGAYLSGYKKGATQSQANQDSSEQTQQGKSEEDTTSKREAELSFELKKPEYIDESLEGSIGEQLESSDGLVMMVTKVDKNFKLKKPSASTDSSMNAVKVDMLLGNSDESKSKAIKSTNFILFDEAGTKITALENLDSSENIPSSFNLNPGMKIKMSVVFLVPQDATGLIFARTQSYQLSSKVVVTMMGVALEDTSYDTSGSNSDYPVSKN